ncbi:MAG: nucleoside deaminase [Cytophagales bacterium]|nr:nucleoside deaminase [Cytophagales bacterium]
MEDTHSFYMGYALEEARKAYQKGEIPVGSVLIGGGRILAKTHNQTQTLEDATAHAELLAITAAQIALGSRYLKGCTLYVSLEPCIMCAGALYWTQLSQLIYACEDEKRGFSRYTPNPLHPQTQVMRGPKREEARALIKEFFISLRQNLNP